MRVTHEFDDEAGTLVLTLEVSATADPEKAADIAWEQTLATLQALRTVQGPAAVLDDPETAAAVAALETAAAVARRATKA